MLRMTDYAPTIDSAIAERNVATYDKKTSPAKYAEPVFGWLLVTLGTLIITLAVVTVLSLTLPRAAGLNAYVVVSGSMEPNYPVNCVVYSKATNPAELKTGEVIMFTNPSRGSTPITHRVVTNDPAIGSIVTKGDANANVDVSPVSYDNVIGKVVMHVPYLGYTALVFSSLIGRILAAAALIAAWFMIEIGLRHTGKSMATISKTYD